MTGNPTDLFSAYPAYPRHSRGLLIREHLPAVRPHLPCPEGGRYQAVEIMDGLEVQSDVPAVFDALAAAFTEAARRLRAVAQARAAETGPAPTDVEVTDDPTGSAS